MRASSAVLFVLAWVCGTGLALLVGRVWFPPTLKVAQTQTATKSLVLVAKNDIAPGTRITAEMIKYEPIPVESVPVGVVLDFSQVANHRATYPIQAGTPLCRLDLTEVQPAEMVQFQANIRKVPVKIDRVSAETHLGQSLIISSVTQNGSQVIQALIDSLRPENVLDLYLLTLSENSGSKQTGGSDKKSLLLLSNINWEYKETSEINNRLNDNAKNNVHLLLNRDQLEMIKNRAQEGRLQLVVSTQSLPNTENATSGQNRQNTDKKEEISTIDSNTLEPNTEENQDNLTNLKQDLTNLVTESVNKPALEQVHKPAVEAHETPIAEVLPESVKSVREPAQKQQPFGFTNRHTTHHTTVVAVPKPEPSVKGSVDETLKTETVLEPKQLDVIDIGIRRNNRPLQIRPIQSGQNQSGQKSDTDNPSLSNVPSNPSPQTLNRRTNLYPQPVMSAQQDRNNVKMARVEVIRQ